jgi:hypothetical protein
MYVVWLGWAYLADTVRKPQRGGVNFDPLMIFCFLCLFYAKCSSCFRNAPGRLSHQIKSFALRTYFRGLGWLW